MNLGSVLRFAWAGIIKHPQTGGVIPSQRFLIEKMIEPVPRDHAGLVIELGAGTGALTTRLAARCPRARIVACELNPELARDAQDSLARAGLGRNVEICAVSAQELLGDRLENRAVPPKFIISGIPLGNLGKRRADETIALVRRALAPDGMYIQFQHSLLDRKRIQAHFARLRIEPVLLNFPPAVVYYATGRPPRA